MPSAAPDDPLDPGEELTPQPKGPAQKPPQESEPTEAPQPVMPTGTEGPMDIARSFGAACTTSTPQR